MATATKKPTPRATKVTSKSKAAVARKKTVTKKAQTSKMRSFMPCNDPVKFMTTTPSVQAFYWIIIGVIVLILVSWTMYLTIQIQDLYDAIELSNVTSSITSK